MAAWTCKWTARIEETSSLRKFEETFGLKWLTPHKTARSVYSSGRGDAQIKGGSEDGGGGGGGGGGLWCSAGGVPAVEELSFDAMPTARKVVSP